MKVKLVKKVGGGCTEALETQDTDCGTNLGEYQDIEGGCTKCSINHSAPQPLPSDMISSKNSEEKIVDNQRILILDSLNQEEKEKFEILEKAVADNCLNEQPIDIAQYLIVSHLEIKESLTRIRKWRKEMRKWKGDQITVSSALDYMRAYPEYTSIGGYDLDGRRVYVLHFGSVIAKDILNDFSRYCKCVKLLWDATTINVNEVKAGLCFVCDFENFGTPSWSLTLFRRVLGLISNRYPIRLRRIYFVDQPAYFLVITKIVMAFLPKKFKDRIQVVSREDLSKIIPKDSLPLRVGGTSKEAADLSSWVVKRLENRHGKFWSRLYEVDQ